MGKQTNNKQNKDISIDNLCGKLASKSIQFNGKSIIYSRVSTKNQSFGMSLDSQFKFCQDYCLENNFNMIGQVYEVVSARFINKQVKLQEIIDNYNNIHLIIYDPTRLSRNMKDYINFMEKCKAKDIIIHFVQDNLISNNNSDIKKIITSVFDGEIESHNLGLRVKRSIQHRKKLGIFYPSITKYGYMYKTKTVNGNIKKIINQDIKEQKIIKLVQKLYYGTDITSVKKLLFDITNIKHKIIDTNDNSEQTQPIEYGNMCFVDITNFLNSNSILKRNKNWNSQAISQLIKSNELNV